MTEDALGFGKVPDAGCDPPAIAEAFRHVDPDEWR
jgi:hypothetical protein